MTHINNNLINKKSKTKKINFKKLTPIFLSVIVFAIIIILISNPKKYNSSIINGFMLFANCVFPGLFPFLFLTKILTELGVIKKLSNLLSKTMNKIFHVSGIASYIFLMSALCGYPMGAKLTTDLVKSGAINKDETNRILSFCSVSGPIFTLGTVGVSMFSSMKVGLIIFASHLLSSIIYGIIYCNIPIIKMKLKSHKKTAKINLKLNPVLATSNHTKNTNITQFSQTIIPNTNANLSANKSHNKISQQPQKTQEPNYDTMLGDSVYNAISTIVVVGAYVTIFFMLIDMVLATKILQPLENVLNSLFTLLGADDGMAHGFLCGLIEMTRGCSELSKFGSTNIWAVTLASGILSFSGLSIIVQSLTLASGTGIKAGRYILNKIFHSVICMVICFTLCLIFI